ncbi:unnamed protein product [Mucor hiemalis]
MLKNGIAESSNNCVKIFELLHERHLSQHPASKVNCIKKPKEDIDQEFEKDNIQDFWKYKAIKANLRSNALNFNVMSSAALSSVSNEIMNMKKREGGSVDMVAKERKKTKTTSEIYMQGGQGPYVFTHKSVVWPYKSSNISSDSSNIRNRCMNHNFNRQLSFVEQIALNGVYYTSRVPSLHGGCVVALRGVRPTHIFFGPSPRLKIAPSASLRVFPTFALVCA